MSRIPVVPTNVIIMRKLLYILSLVFTVTLFVPSFAIGEGEDRDDLVIREGLRYKKFSDVPFTGKTTGLTQWSFKNGKLDGPLVSYWKNGQLQEKGTYKNGKQEGLWVSYWDNGQLNSKGKWKDNKQEGLWVFYHKNGQLSDKGNYKDGKKEGPWVGYKEDGSVWEKFTGVFKNDTKIKYKAFR